MEARDVFDFSTPDRPLPLEALEAVIRDVRSRPTGRRNQGPISIEEQSMGDPWKRLAVAWNAANDWIWGELAQQGYETAALAPLAESPIAASWLAGRLAECEDEIAKKLGAMLLGLIKEPEQAELLQEMLYRARSLFATDPLTANSVGEDIMFAASRWASYPGETQAMGQRILAEMVRDALNGTPWNTANWAAANLQQTTGGSHSVLEELKSTDPSQLAGQSSLLSFAEALRSQDDTTIARHVTEPAPLETLPPDTPNLHLLTELIAAIREAEVDASKPD